eukprot:COSAG01_NODE_68335_length_264_cov_0.921212_1_plen_49_part_01
MRVIKGCDAHGSAQPQRLNFCCRQALLPAASDLLVVGSLSLPALGKEMD